MGGSRGQRRRTLILTSRMSATSRGGRSTKRSSTFPSSLTDISGTATAMCGRKALSATARFHRAAIGSTWSESSIGRGRATSFPRAGANTGTGRTTSSVACGGDRPATTIRTEFHKPEKGRYLHPTEDRAITVREAASLMSFPSHHKLPEDQPMTAMARQIGNAVPPLMARRLAEPIAGLLDEAASESSLEQVA
ncbi:DNA cytosine methyltransferase [Svornostia abyssi]|uniref:DNA cytosine methyltransferase n=1 Tax=Svornostia abyssi TaxID=2898438 RepID=UPI00338F8087